MSISYKKVNSMISEQIDSIDSDDAEQKALLKDLCEKIYMIESSVDQMSSHQIIRDIMGEITNKSSDYKGL